MDNLTQTMVGVALSRAFFKNRMPYATTAMIVAVNLPDIDLLWSWGGINYIEFHRGITDSVLFWPILAVLFAAGARWVARHYQKPVPRWDMLIYVGLIGIGAHILLDYTNAWGVRLFAPFDPHWYALDLEPILDLWIWIGFFAFLGFPMVLNLINTDIGARRKNHRASAIAVLLALVAWVGWRYVEHGRALDMLSTADMAGFYSPEIQGYYQGYDPSGIGAFPDTDPRQWTDVVSLPQVYLVAYADAATNQVVPARTFLKPPADYIGLRAQTTKYGGIFMWFARFPLVEVENNGDDTVVIMTDMRFARPSLRSRIPLRPQMRAMVTLAPSGAVVKQQFVGPGVFGEDFNPGEMSRVLLPKHESPQLLAAGIH